MKPVIIGEAKMICYKVGENETEIYDELRLNEWVYFWKSMHYYGNDYVFALVEEDNIVWFEEDLEEFDLTVPDADEALDAWCCGYEF